MIKIATDSCADLSQELLDARAIASIPLHVMVNGVDYHDNELSLAELFSSVEKTGNLPQTAAPSIQEFIDLFDHQETTVYIGLSSQLSATMQNAKIAADQIARRDLHLVDSLNLSTGIGLLVLKAADLRDEGMSAEEIAQEISGLRQKVRTSFTIDTMDYLHKGGRCTGLQAFVGSVLKIRPVIHVRKDGTLGVLDKVRGNRKKALDAMLDRFRADLPNVDLTRVFVTHSGCEEDADYLVEQLMKLASIKNIFITSAGATIGSHCGPNTIGILYLMK